MSKSSRSLPKPSSSGGSLFTNIALAIAGILALVGLIDFVPKLIKSLASNIQVYPQGGLIALGVLAGLVVLVFITSFIGKTIGEQGGKRKIPLMSVLGDQLTHIAIWLVILFSIYPVFYVIAASFDPLNRTFKLTLPESDNVFIRSQVIPSFEGASLENYANLFEGVVIYPLQWLMLVVFALGLLWLAVVAAQVQFVHSGFPPISLRKQRTWATYLAVAGVALFFITLSTAQFTGTTTESKFLMWFRNTFVISTFTGILAILLTTTAGYAMARLRFPGRFETLMFFIFVQMFPGFLGLIAVFNLISTLGLLNTFPGLILAYSGGAIAFGTWIYKGYVESLPASLEEAALVDGCTRWTAFTKIVLPLSGPMLVFIFLLQFIGTYAEYLLASILLTGVDQWTIGVGLRSFTTQFATNWGTFAAASVLASIPIVALFYSFQQVFVSGTLAGGVKE
jgi:arabinogalactan oligomer / maltooligosaccharide transport system permease protein